MGIHTISIWKAYLGQRYHCKKYQIITGRLTLITDKGVYEKILLVEVGLRKF